jgi:tetratricopeptide (TPR) repeat protein
MNQALLENRIGFFDRAINATKKAVDLFERAGDGRGRVGALANLVFLYACTRQVQEARESAETALDLARRFGFGFLEASVSENVAVAEAVAGDYAQAIEIAESSLELRAGSESEVWSSKTLADLAIWYGALGNLPAARDKVGRLLADEDAIMRATDWPSYCYWAAAQIFHLDGESAKATRARESARRLMQTTAEQLEAEDREHFLALPWHVDLMQAVTKNLWPNPPR